MNTQQRESFLERMDKTMIGFVLGLILPMGMLVLLYFFKFKSYGSWNEYISTIQQHSILPSIIRNCVFINLPFFFLFNLVKKFNLCKGIFISSLLYIAAMLVIKFIL